MEDVKDGDLYKRITHSGVKIDIIYGYYEEFERDSRFGEPVPIYPDFLSSPVYTADGYPCVTQMQGLCEHGESRFSDGCCVDCSHFEYVEDLIGICKCKSRINNEKEKSK